MTRSAHMSGVTREPAWAGASMVQVPLPLVIFTVAVPAPPDVIEQIDALAESTASETVRPESELAPTVKVLLYAAVDGAACVNLIVWVAVDAVAEVCCCVAAL